MVGGAVATGALIVGGAVLGGVVGGQSTGSSVQTPALDTAPAEETPNPTSQAVASVPAAMVVKSSRAPRNIVIGGATLP